MKSIVIVGGGVFGLGAAIDLAKRGAHVTLFDRSPLPAVDAASTDISKIVRMDYGKDEIYLRLVARALVRWRNWNGARLARAQPPVYHEVGVALMSSCAIEDSFYERESLRNIAALVNDRARDLALRTATVEPVVHRLRSTPLSASASAPPSASASQWASGGISLSSLSRGFHAGLDARYPDGYLNATGGWADATETMRYMADEARGAGVVLIDGGDRGTFKSYISKQGSPEHIIGIETADGKRHHADLVIVAAGSWTPYILPESSHLLTATGHPVIHIRLDATQRAKYSSQHSQFPVWMADISNTGFYGFPEKNGLIKIANHGHGYLNPTKLEDGRLISLPQTVVSHKDMSIPVDAVHLFRKFVSEHFPEMLMNDIAATRMCWYCDSHDGDFFIDYVPNKKGLFVASGGSGHGFKFAPIIGEVIADIVEGKQSEYSRLFRWREHAQAIKESSRSQTPEAISELNKKYDLRFAKPATASDLKGLPAPRL